MAALSGSRFVSMASRWVRSTADWLCSSVSLLAVMSVAMKRSRFSAEQIAYALHLAESGTPVVDVCRQIDVSEAMYYSWKKRFGDLTCPL